MQCALAMFLCACLLPLSMAGTVKRHHARHGKDKNTSRSVTIRKTIDMLIEELSTERQSEYKLSM